VRQNSGVAEYGRKSVLVEAPKNSLTCGGCSQSELLAEQLGVVLSGDFFASAENISR
jgi:hypothetical protein